MKKVMCSCFSSKKMIGKQLVYPYIEVPMFGHEMYSSDGKQEVLKVQMDHNFCPKCGAKYEDEVSP